MRDRLQHHGYCSICPICYNPSESHEVNDHINESHPTSCKICLTFFKTPDGLKTHSTFAEANIIRSLIPQNLPTKYRNVDTDGLTIAVYAFHMANLEKIDRHLTDFKCPVMNVDGSAPDSNIIDIMQKCVSLVLYIINLYNKLNHIKN